MGIFERYGRQVEEIARWLGLWRPRTRIVGAHLTRMQPGYICVAGIDIDTGHQIRPVLSGMNHTRAALRQHGGPYAIASVVDLGAIQDVGAPPEVEDRQYDASRARSLGIGGQSTFWQALQNVSHTNLTDIFGDVLEPRERGCAVEEGTGKASLGCLRPAVQPRLLVDTERHLRLLLHHAGSDLDLPITDLRFYGEDQRTVLGKAVDAVAERLRSGTPVILSMGLTRPWLKPGDSAKRHWLQVNNIHLADDPTWSGEDELLKPRAMPFISP